MKLNQHLISKLLVFGCALFFSAILFGQNYNHPKTGTQTITLNQEGVYNYYDDGGAFNSYSNNIYSSITFKVNTGFDLYYRVVEVDMDNDLCEFDYLEVDQQFQQCQNFGTQYVCAEYLPESGEIFPVCGNSISFTFSSDNIDIDKGWHIEFRVVRRDLDNSVLCVNGLQLYYTPCEIAPSFHQIDCQDFTVSLVPEEIKNNGFVEEFNCWLDPTECTKNGKGDIDFYPPFSGIYGLPERKFYYAGEDGADLCIETDCPDVIQDIFLVNGCVALQKGIKSGNSFCFTNVPASTWLQTTYFIAEYDCPGDFAYCGININCGKSWNCPDFPDAKCCDVINSTNANGVNSATQYQNCYISSQGTYSGPEKVYRFIATDTGPVTVELYGLNDDLDLFILDNCDINSTCGQGVNISHEPNANDELVTFNAIKGQDYYIVIDGWEGAISDYTLEIHCEPIVCNPCGECFTYTTFNETATTKVNCYNRYSNCISSGPTNYTYKWFVDNVQKSTLENPVLDLINGSSYKVCQKVYNVSGTVIFECCWDIVAKKGCASPPVANFTISALTNNKVTFDPGSSKDGIEFTWKFGDGTPDVIKTNSDKLDHTFPQSGIYTVCLYVLNENGISCYCIQVKAGSSYFTCQNKATLPQFTTSLNNNELNITAPSAQTSDIYEFSIDYGDGSAPVNNSIWNGSYKHTYPAGKKSYQICITYKKRYIDSAGNCCIYYGCYCFTQKMGCCSSVIDNCSAINYSFVSENQGLNYELNHTSGGVQIESWEIDDVVIPNSAGNLVNYKFPGAGTYKVCCYYYDGAGCLVRCCRYICVSNPFICNLIKYSFNESNGYKFSIDNSSGDYEDISWTVDAPFNQDLGTGAASKYLPLPVDCKSYTISVRFFDKKCGGYRICCITIYICNPFTCGNSGNINYSFGDDGFHFNIDNDDVSDVSWTFDDNNEFVGTGKDVIYTGPLNCIARPISVRYYDNICKCWRICCKIIWICDPFECGNILYNYTPAGYQFSIDNPFSVYQNMQWTVDSPNPSPLGQGDVSGILPVNGNCEVYIVTARFFDNSCKCWRICCIPIYKCDPKLCGNSFVSSLKNQVLNLSVASGINAIDIEWYNETTGALLGTGENLQITNVSNSINVCMKYYDPVAECYKICCDIVSSINDPGLLKLYSIVPNPSNNHFSIQSGSSSTISKLDIIDVTGRVVYTISNYTAGNDISTSLPAGMYTVSLKVKEDYLNLKLIIVE